MTTPRASHTDCKEKMLAIAREFDLIVARRVRSLRRSRGMTIQELAGGLGVTQQQVQKYESGLNRIPAGRLAIVAYLLGVDVNDLYTRVCDQV